MATKPSALPRWASTDSTYITEASTAAKNAGWTPGTRPPAQWMNWFQNLVYLWIAWLDAFESEAHVWSQSQDFSSATFDDEVIFLAGGSATFEEGLQIAKAIRVDIDVFPADTGVFDFIGSTPPTMALMEKFGSGSGIVRRYFDITNSRLVTTVNAKWSGTNWVKDTAAASLRHHISNTGSTFELHAPNTTPFAEGAWVKQARIGGGGYQDGLIADVPIEFTSAALAKTVAQQSILSVGLVPKAWVRVKITSGVVASFNGQNIADVVISSAANGRITVSLAAGVSRATRMLLPRVNGVLTNLEDDDLAVVLGSTDSDIVLTAKTIATNAAVNLTSASMEFSLLVFGFQ